MTVAELLNKYLRTLYDIDDNIYKSLISDVNGSPEVVISDPIDYNIGVIADILEWTRQLSISLGKQIFLNQAEGKYLDLLAHNNIGLVRYPSENDTDYISRVQKFIIGRKVSPAAIIFYMRPYSDIEPAIIEGGTDTAFSDITFNDVFTTFQQLTPGSEFGNWVNAAIAGSDKVASHFFTLVLEGSSASDIPLIIDTMNRLIAAGVGYEVQIN